MKNLKPPTPSELKKLRNNLLLFYPQEDNQSPTIDYLIQKVWDDVLIYCHLEEMPEDLHGTIEQMVLENLQTFRWLDNKEDIEDGNIKEISEGDVTIKKVTDGEAMKMKASLSGGLIPYYYKLNSYRVVKK